MLLNNLVPALALVASAAASPATHAFPRDVTATVAGPLGLNNANCKPLSFNVAVKTNNVVINNVDDNYSNQTYVSDIILQLSARMPEFMADHLPGTTKPFAGSFNVAATYCEPKQGAKANSSLIVAVHGIGFDSSYWNFAYAPSYSFVKQAASYGYSTLIYDRLGTGKSEAPSKGGFSVVQAPTEVGILREILGKVRNGTLPGVPSGRYTKTTLVGHSYGSAQSESIAKNYPDLIDGLVLTGFSTFTNYTANFFQAGAYTISSQVRDLPLLAAKPSIYLSTGSSTSDLINFFQPFGYDQGAFDLARVTEQPTTLGAFATIGAIGGPAPNYTGPVLVVDGERDFPFCGTNCRSTTPTIPQGVQALFPAASDFESLIVNNTGHGIVAHRTGPQTSVDILKYIAARGL